MLLPPRAARREGGRQAGAKHKGAKEKAGEASSEEIEGSGAEPKNNERRQEEVGRSPELAGLMGGMKNQRDENADLGQRLSRRWSGSRGSRPLMSQWDTRGEC